MQSRTRRTLARAATVCAAALVALIAAWVPATAAGPDEDYEGWFVALDAANTQPTGLDQRYANIVDQTSGFQRTGLLSNDKDFTWSVKAGYSWGKLGALSVSYWSFDHGDTIERTDANDAVYPNVFGGYPFNYSTFYGYGGGLFPGANPVTYKVRSQVKASTLDLDYTRPIVSGERTTLNWIAGLRSATWEETVDFSGSGTDYTAVDVPYTIMQERHNKADAFGIKMGADVKFGFTEHFGIEALYAFSFLQGSNDATSTQTTIGVDPVTPLTTTAFDQSRSKDDHLRGEIRDYDLRAVWSLPRLEVYVGYGGQTWDGLVSDPTGSQAVCCNAGSAQPAHASRNSVAFNSAHAGVVFRFGRR